MAKSAVAVALTVLVLIGCGGKDVLKHIESKAYDKASEAVSDYCRVGRQKHIAMERTEARREIRQRGDFGPAGPDAAGDLDAKTAYGPGPVIRIWCEGEAVPESIWNDLVR